MAKLKNVVNHWHYFPKDELATDDKRVDICEQSDGNFVVCILESGGQLNFDSRGSATLFVKLFMLGRHLKPAVDMNNDEWFSIHN